MSSSQTNPKEVAQDLLIFPSAHGAPCSPTLLCWLGEKGLSPGREYPWRFGKRADGSDGADRGLCAPPALQEGV